MMRRFPARQRGVAVVTALLLTTLAVSIVASLFWQQQVQVRSLENQYLHFQTRWMLRGGLDFTRFILREDLRTGQGLTRLDGIWATPLRETRVDEFADRQRVEGESFNATISGQTYDAQSRYNLANLASTDGAGGINKAQLAVFSRLLQNLQLDPGLARTVAIQVVRSQGVGQAPQPGTPPQPNVEPVPAGSGRPMKLLRVEDLLAVTGFDQRAVEKLRDLVVALPEPTPVNVNTAPAPVLAALAGMSLSEGQGVALARERTFFRNADDFKAQLQARGKSLPENVQIDVTSRYFLVMSRVKLDRAELISWSLVQRDQNGTRVVWIREI
ncbi:type II secretion system minor pseudopilin GspK [Pseudoduganella violaceinigra]|uniref:type II secretion system minor pseudopilin GspK n=1 Tax=Pseudoduganella violaceinigra TaxID=246602 RepID=UPI00041084CD|nr:type II secretion system minor pseudopilin GspK [Pseudoduganella violaceinigra]